MVPVLSTTTVLTLCNFSSVAASLIKIPSLAPLPTPTIIAVGVASPRAQGHAMTSTPTNDISACDNANENPSGPVPNTSHTTIVTSEITKTTVTNTADTLSASA